MRLAVVLQFVATACFALIALAFAGATAGLSGLLGGLCATIPNAVFAARLALNKGRSAESYPVVFFLGEFIKVGLIISLFGAVIAWDGEKHWLALIGGLIVALKVPLFAMWFGGSRAPIDLSALPKQSEQKKHQDWEQQDCGTNTV
ncbi:MAG: ATP synthase subunit I [Burkholderiaceae bacterium]